MYPGGRFTHQEQPTLPVSLASSLLLPLPPPLPSPPTLPFPPTPLLLLLLLLFGCALSSLSRARVSAHTRAPVRFYILRASAQTRRPAYGRLYGCYVRVCVCVCVCDRAQSTHGPAHARVSRFSSLSHVCNIRASKSERGRERERERKKDTLPFLVALATAAARNRSLTRSHRHKLPCTRAHAPPMHTDTHTHALARARFDFPIQSFPSRKTRADSPRRETRAVRLVV